MRSDRILSRDKVYKILEIEGSLTQADIARKTGLAPATVNYTVNALKKEGLAESEWVNGRQALISLVSNQGSIVSLSISSEFIEGSLFHFGEKKRYQFKQPSSHMTEDLLVDNICSWVESCSKNEKKREYSLLGVSLSIRAPFNHITQDIVSWAKGLLFNWDLKIFKEKLEEQLRTSVIIENDGNLAAMTEWMWNNDAEERVSNFVYLTCGDHVGGGIVLNGQLYRGVDGMAGELGHVFARSGGTICVCGGRGCLSSDASELALLSKVVHLCPDVHTAQDVITLAEKGNYACRRALHDVGYSIGIVISNIYRIISPQTICLSGYLTDCNDYILPGIKVAFEDRGLLSSYEDIDIKSSFFSSDAAILGGIALVLSSREQSLTKLQPWMLNNA